MRSSRFGFAALIIIFIAGTHPLRLSAQVQTETYFNLPSASAVGASGNGVVTITAPRSFVWHRLEWDGFAVPQLDEFGLTPSWGQDLAIRIEHIPSGGVVLANLDRPNFGTEDFSGGQQFYGQVGGFTYMPINAGDTFQLEFFELFDDGDPDGLPNTNLPNPDAIWEEIRIDLHEFEYGNAFFEQGDAPEFPAAQPTLGTGNIDTIVGMTDPAGGDYVDAYQIRVTDPASFSVSTDASYDDRGAAEFDSRLWLFDDGGNLVMANDDNPVTLEFQSLMTNPAQFPGVGFDDPRAVEAGAVYTLVVSGWLNDPLDAANRVLADIGPNHNADLSGPNPNAGGFAQWRNGAGRAEGGRYVLSLQGAEFAIVPEPAWGLWTIVLSLVPLAQLRRRMQPLDFFRQ
jgi:hypothetical protein